MHTIIKDALLKCTFPTTAARRWIVSLLFYVRRYILLSLYQVLVAFEPAEAFYVDWIDWLGNCMAVILD